MHHLPLVAQQPFVNALGEMITILVSDCKRVGGLDQEVIVQSPMLIVMH